MSPLAALVSDSRLDQVMGQIERGEPVDCRRVLALQALDVARAERIALAEALKREEEADEWLRETVEAG